MSKIALTPNASGTGTLTIAAPNTSTDRTLTLPDSTGTIDTLNRAGNVLQVVQYVFNPSTELTTSNSYQASSFNLTIQKNSTSNKIIIIVAGAHMYISGGDNGVLSTICQEGSSSTFTASTTYASGNDPASAYTYGMQQVYNQVNISTAPQSKLWLFASTGYEFEAYRCFYKSRYSGKNAYFHESGNVATMTAMEIAA